MATDEGAAVELPCKKCKGPAVVIEVPKLSGALRIMLAGAVRSMAGTDAPTGGPVLGFSPEQASIGFGVTCLLCVDQVVTGG